MDNARRRRYPQTRGPPFRGGQLDELAAGRIVERAGLEAALSREDLEAVLDAVGEGIAIGDLDGKIVFANAAAARLLGVETADEVRESRMREHRRRFEIFDVGGRP